VEGATLHGADLLFQSAIIAHKIKVVAKKASMFYIND
jgi:hypothetical protein